MIDTQYIEKHLNEFSNLLERIEKKELKDSFLYVAQDISDFFNLHFNFGIFENEKNFTQTYMSAVELILSNKIDEDLHFELVTLLKIYGENFLI